MRIAFVSTFPPTRCGIAEYCYDLISAIKTISKNVYIEVFADNDTIQRFDNNLNIYIHKCFIKGVEGFDELYLKLVERGPFDIIHIQHEYSLFPQMSKGFLELIKNIKDKRLCKELIITMHNVYHLCKGLEYIKYQREICRNVDKIIVHSILQQYELWSQGVCMEKIQLIPHGTPINKYVNFSKDELARALNLTEIKDTFNVLIPGFIRWDKGFDIIIKISDILSNIDSKIRLIISGIPQGFDGMKIYEKLKIAKRKNIFAFFKYLTKNELLALVSFADVILLPYREHPGHIGVSGMLHTAISGYKPIIATKVPRLIEYQEIMPELMLDDLKPEDIVDLILYVKENYNYIIRKIRRMYKKFIIDTNWYSIALKHLKFYIESKSIPSKLIQISK